MALTDAPESVYFLLAIISFVILNLIAGHFLQKADKSITNQESVNYAERYYCERIELDTFFKNIKNKFFHQTAFRTCQK